MFCSKVEQFLYFIHDFKQKIHLIKRKKPEKFNFNPQKKNFFY